MYYSTLSPGRISGLHGDFDLRGHPSREDALTPSRLLHPSRNSSSLKNTLRTRLLRHVIRVQEHAFVFPPPSTSMGSTDPHRSNIANIGAQ
ncbi:hypothetical protein THAOC_22929 [Thalassiosira oceanica]|uniref:Uncharacterized protein n=1 Tax=Thalassiosira oceanica TaxID=159749 RepID=K0RT88_THAOC|nr:hypothetical protein THAOC_22929 [Thalassiosira oceanica]|eukprot:EJK57068.1 hypothetical protein THAOC_22929 [Thalassiosira oceanica]